MTATGTAPRTDRHTVPLMPAGSADVRHLDALNSLPIPLRVALIPDARGIAFDWANAVAFARKRASWKG